jgi:hypothetical protein
MFSVEVVSCPSVPHATSQIYSIEANPLHLVAASQSGVLPGRARPKFRNINNLPKSNVGIPVQHVSATAWEGVGSYTGLSTTKKLYSTILDREVAESGKVYGSRR